MSAPDATPATFMSKHRLEALSDGVFAVVMTLLVLEIKPELEPHASNEAVRHMLRGLALPVLTYLFAFFLAAIFWNLHHRKFALLRHTNPLHTALTLAFLCSVTLVPVSVSIYLKSKATSLALAVYFGNFSLITLPLLASWLYAQRVGLTDTSRPAAEFKHLTQRMVSMTALFFFAMAVAVFEWPLILILFAMPIVFYYRLKERWAKTKSA